MMRATFTLDGNTMGGADITSVALISEERGGGADGSSGTPFR
jgi:hypothetical protein